MKITDEMVDRAREMYATFGQSGHLRAAAPSIDVVTAMLTAALPVQTQQGMEVKKLEWERNGWVEAFSHVNALGLWYSISPEKPVRGAGEPPFACYAIHGAPSSISSVRKCLGDDFQNLEAAKAAAQSDYETRIRSALVDVPAVESEPVAFHVRVKGWGEEIVFTEDGAHRLIKRLRRTKAVTGDAEIIPLYAHPPRSLSNEGWRPIETAPKNGTAVDLWCINHLHYAKQGQRVVNVAWGRVRDWMGNERDDWQHGHGEDFEPTHWCPIPTPPSTRKGSSEGDGSSTITKDADHG